MNTTFDADGALHVPAHTLPVSDFVSDAFREAYARHLTESLSWPVRLPSMDAPKAEWDAFDEEVNRVIFGPSTKWVEEHYPVDFEETITGGVHVGVVTPKGSADPANANRVLINLHGGGFTMGRGLVAGKGEAIPVAALSGIKVITVDYRMVPYAAFPAASEDVEAVYRELLKDYRPDQIGIFGTSAGGALTAQSVVWLESKGLPRPAAVGIFAYGPVFPWLQGDSTAWGGVGIFEPQMPASSQVQQSDDPVPAGTMDYFKGASMDDPRVLPGESPESIARFPPTLWITGTRSADMSPVIVSHARFLKCGVDSYLYVLEGGQHGAYNVGQYATPEAHDTLSYVAHWFQQHLAS